MECETGGGIVRLNTKLLLSSAIQWITGMELFLLVKDPWSIALTTDHNAGPFSVILKLSGCLWIGIIGIISLVIAAQGFQGAGFKGS